MKPSKKVEIVYPGYTEKFDDFPLDSSFDKADVVYKTYTDRFRELYGRKPEPPNFMLDLNRSILFPHDFRFGFRRKVVSLVASPPGGGKTTFLLNAIDNLITAGKFNIAVFLPDMPPAEFCAMLTAVRAGVDYRCFRKGGIQSDKREAIQKAGKEIASAKLWFSNERTFSTESVSKAALKLNLKLKEEKKKLDLIFIDSFNYLEGCGDPVGPKGWNFEQLTDLAKETDSAVVCSYGLEPEKENELTQRRLWLRDFRIRGISEAAVGLIINIVHADYSDPSVVGRDEVLLDIVWDKFGPYGEGLFVMFNRETLRFYTNNDIGRKNG